MLGSIEAFQEEKAKAKKLQKDIGTSSMSLEFDSDYDGDDLDTPQNEMPSFEESSSFPIKGRVGPRASNFKRPRRGTGRGLDSFFVPRTTPGAQPTIDAKWKKMEKEGLLGSALLDGGMMQTYLLMQLILPIINL